MTDGFPAFKKKPFERKHLDSAQDIVNIRFNDTERAMLSKVKDIARCDADGTILKKSLEFVHNALLGLSQEQVYRWFSEPRRIRPGPK